MKIILFRHGEPIGFSSEPISANSMKAWVAQYNSAVIKPQSQPNEQALAIASKATLIVSSDLARSKASAMLLSSSQAIEENGLFAEAGLPYTNRSLFKAKPKVWLVLFRVLWYFGYSFGSESRSEVKARSIVAVQELIKLANKNQCIALVGHGIFNRFLARELILQGFKGSKYPTSKYWGSSIYERALLQK